MNPVSFQAATIGIPTDDMVIDLVRLVASEAKLAWLL